MKNLSRLTALLLALVMLLSITASATEISNYTKADYDADVVAAQSQTEITAPGVLTAEHNGFSFAVEGEVPETAQLYVTHMGDDTAANIRTNILSLPELEEGMSEYAFDITIVNDNAVWQPGTPVEVTINGLDTTSDSFVQVYHIPDSQPAVATLSLMDEDTTPAMTFEEVEATPGEGTVTFMADGFSTYYVVTGTANGSSVGDTTIRNLPGEASTYFVEPGTVITFAKGIFEKDFSFSLVSSGAGISLSGKTVTVALNAEVDTTAVYRVSRGYNLTFIVSNRNTVITGAIEEHPVYLALKTDVSSGIPNEPGNTEGDYVRVSSTYGTGWNNTFASTAENVIDESIRNSLIGSVDGTATVGVNDATGALCMQYLISNAINWDRLMDIAVNNNAKASDGTRVDSSNRINYVVIPYVIKLMAEKGTGWHIDCAVVPANRITLSYDLNLKNYVIAGTTLTLPNAITSATRPLTETIGSITGASVGTELHATMNGQSFTVKFLGWSKDPNATTPDPACDPGDRITINEDTVLYAVWSGKADTGNLAITKTVVGEGAPVDDTFTFTVEYNVNATLGYTVTDSSDTIVRNGSIISGGTLTLKAGQTATITEIPLNTTYTVTEAEKANYTQSSTGDSGKIEVKDETKIAAFTNTFSIPTATLTIEKKVSGAYENQSFIFNVSGPNYDAEIVITGEGTVKLVDLEPGIYTVTEDPSWSWEYTADDAEQSTTLAGGDDKTIEFTNTAKPDKWLSDESAVENKFN